MSTYTTTDIAAESVLVMNIKISSTSPISAPHSSTSRTSSISAPLSPTAATFIPAKQSVDSAQRPLSPDATKFASDTRAAERKSLSPKAPSFIPATKARKSPLLPHAAVFDPRRQSTPPVERRSVPLPTARLFLPALLDRYTRRIMQRLDALEQLEQQPTHLGRTFGQDLQKGMWSYFDYEVARDSLEGQLRRLIDRYKAVKALLDAPVGADPEEEKNAWWLLDSEYQITSRR